jgi:hypothetical protein
METGGAQHRSESATEAEASARAANLAMEADKNLTAMGADGEKPYSPSDPLDSDDQEKAMEWEASLPSIKHLYKQPHDTSEAIQVREKWCKNYYQCMALPQRRLEVAACLPTQR